MRLPCLTKEVTLLIRENTTDFTYTITATDPDTYANYTTVIIIYDIPMNADSDSSGIGSGLDSDSLPESNLRINELTGVLSLDSPLDYEMVRNFTVTITASDPNNMALSDIATVEIQVQEINDNAPMFSRNDYIVMVSENISVSSVITDEISATDDDTVSDGMLRYSIDRGIPNRNALGHF